MIVQKVFGITQISPGTALEYRVVQFFTYLGILGFFILWFICMFLWPFYYFYKLYRYFKHDEKMGGEDEGYYPWGVRYGCIWNTLVFIGLYVIMPIKLVETCERERAEKERMLRHKTEYIYNDPYNTNSWDAYNGTADPEIRIQMKCKGGIE